MSEGQRARHGISLSLSGRSDKAVAVCQAPLMNGRSLPMVGGDGGHENGDSKTKQGGSWSSPLRQLELSLLQEMTTQAPCRSRCSMHILEVGRTDVGRAVFQAVRFGADA